MDLAEVLRYGRRQKTSSAVAAAGQGVGASVRQLGEVVRPAENLPGGRAVGKATRGLAAYLKRVYRAGRPSEDWLNKATPTERFMERAGYWSVPLGGYYALRNRKAPERPPHHAPDPFMSTHDPYLHYY